MARPAPLEGVIQVRVLAPQLISIRAIVEHTFDVAETTIH